MREHADSAVAQQRLRLMTQLQRLFVQKLQAVAEELGESAEFKRLEWLRDNGRHGGGLRFVADAGLFNRASINVSQIHFADLPDKSLLSATALSAIIHPAHPLAPSLHIHLSWSELKSGRSYWRIMADLNPAIVNQQDKRLFSDTLRAFSGNDFAAASEAGDKYFYIPALQRCRGVSHFYLEGFNPDSNSPLSSPENFVEEVISCYCTIVKQHLSVAQKATAQQQRLQLDYHTLYFYQVLTLDRGTTAGLLAHGQNDIGTLGSLPARIDRSLLASWQEKTASPQNELIARLLLVLGEHEICEISEQVKAGIAEQLRLHYAQYPLP